MPVEIALNLGFVAIVDDCDSDIALSNKWFANHTKGSDKLPYVTRQSGRRTIYLHREIMKAAPGQIVDHANRNPLDNRRCNLRFASPSQNSANSAPPRGESGFRGVARASAGRRWRATIHANNKQIACGSYDTPEEAARAYDRAAIQHFGDFATLNFPVSG